MMAYNNDDHRDALEHIRQAFAVQRRALDGLEDAIIKGFDQQSEKQNGSPLLLSADEVAQRLGMGRSWVYQ